METQSRFEWVDNIRFIATISVVILHVSATPMYYFSQIPASHWIIADIISSSVRFCVPFFLMISGVLLLQQNITPAEFYKKRFIRVFLPFIFWSVIYSIVYYVYFTVLKGNKLTFADILSNFLLYQSYFRSIGYHLWYVYVSLGIYILSPFLQKNFAQGSKNNSIHFIIIFLIIIILNSGLFNFSSLVKSIFSFMGYTCYFIAGTYISKMQRIFNLKQKIIMLILILFLIGFTAYATYLITNENNVLDQEFLKFLSPNIIIMSFLLYILIFNLKIKNKAFRRLRDIINKYSYGIFLSHVLVLFAIEKLGLSWSFIHPIVGISLGSILTLSVTLTMVFLLNKIPVFNKLVG